MASTVRRSFPSIFEVSGAILVPGGVEQREPACSAKNLSWLMQGLGAGLGSPDNRITGTCSRCLPSHARVIVM